MPDYRLKYDFHTHTVFSHGKGTIEQNVMRAREIGLAAIAISDHGPGHMTYGIKRSDIGKMREEISRLNEKYDDIEIYLSVEANIISVGNCLDITPDECELFDFIIAGYHYGIPNGYSVRNFINEKFFFAPSAIVNRLKNQNTDMCIRAIYENDISFVTHPGDKGPFDLDEIARACMQRGTLMEINTRHRHLTVQEIERVMEYDIKFIVNSDAHTVSAVGACDQAIDRALSAGLDMARIVNVERIDS